MTETQKGHLYIIFEGLIWALFPIVTILGLKNMPSIVGLFWATSFSALFFLALMIYRNKWSELKNLKVWKYSLGVAIFIGVIFYGLFFYGLTKTVSTNGAIVGLFEVVTSFLFFQIFKKQQIPKKYIIGVILATIGALLIFIPKFGHFYVGDLFILLATFFAPIGNWFQQKGRMIASSETIMFVRTLITSIFLFIFSLLTNLSPVAHLSNKTIWWILLNGILIFGISKILWIEGIHRINVTKALAINSLSPFFTMIFAFIIIGDSPNYAQLFSLPFLIIGVFLLTNFDFGKFSFKNKKTELS